MLKANASVNEIQRTSLVDVDVANDGGNMSDGLIVAAALQGHQGDGT